MDGFIERRALWKKIALIQERRERDGQLLLAKAIDLVIRLVENFPAADVAPVVHGRWDGEKDHGEFREVKCTACGGILLVKWSTRLSEYNYCPNCGARMDGDKE